MLYFEVSDYFTAVVIGFSKSTYALLESSGQVKLMIVVFSGELERSVEVILQTYGHSPTGQIDGNTSSIAIHLHLAYGV